jgi:hypothetical protein
MVIDVRTTMRCGSGGVDVACGEKSLAVVILLSDSVVGASHM